MSKMYFEVKKYIPEKHLDDIMIFFKEQKVNFNFKTFKSCKTLKLKFHNNNQLYGGDDDTKKIKINLRDNNYEAKIYEYDTQVILQNNITGAHQKNENIFLGCDGYSKTINFVKIHAIYNKNIDDYNEDDTQEKHLSDFSGAHQKFDNKFLGCICGVIIISKDENNKDVANIQSITNYTDCIKCLNNMTFKIGEILTQIMIGVCVYKNIYKIQLTDNSYLECGNEKIPLIYLRTMTHGKPYYIKFNFLPIDHNKKGENKYHKNEIQIYKDNIKIFNTNPKINKKKLIKILNYKKFDEIKDKDMIEYINNELIPQLKEDEISISNFVKYLIKNKKKITCHLLMKILMNMYYMCNYNEYKYKYFEFILDKKYKDIVKSHIKIKNL